MTPLEHARAYLAGGWNPIPVPAGRKAPSAQGWQNIHWTNAEELKHHFAGDVNVGVLLGQPSGGLVDVDLDCAEALELASTFLPPTTAVFGRTSTPASHWLYLSEGAETKRYQEPGGATLVELRGTGLQTIFPPSRHPSGEPVLWKSEGPPTSIDPELLKRAVGELAAACLLARAWPKKGSRQDTALALSGCLLRGGWMGEHVERFLGTVCRAARDEETSMRIATVGTTVERLFAGREATGAPRLADLLGDGIVDLAWRWLELRAANSREISGEGRPRIVVEGGELPEMVDAAEEALIAEQADQIFQRGNLLVRVVRSPAATMREVYKKAPGALAIVPVDQAFLVERLTRIACWVKQSEDGERVIDCPTRVARTYLARAGDWRVPVLLGVIEAPTLRPDGSILSTPGYDPKTCLWFEPGNCKFPTIPERPSIRDALKALELLREPIERFPWVDPSDEAAALAAILTSLVRASLRTAPLTAFRAPKMGAGKSLLADVVAMIATGRVASVMSQGKDEDEDKKRLLAILIEGASVACIDNIERPFGGEAMCSVLTQESWRDRILGKTGTATVPTSTTWLATGNNLCFVGDITTRAIPCDLDPKCERPEEREFEINLHDWVPDNRGRLVAAGLTILRAYVVADKPKQNLSVFGRFEDWSDLIRSALVWCGAADPCEGRSRIEESDPIRSQLRALLIAWHEAFQYEAKSVAEVIRHADPGGADGEDLWQALLGVAGKSGKVDGRRLGNYLAKYERRQEAGLRFERAGDRQRTILWRCSPGPPGPPRVSFVGLVSSSDAAAPTSCAPGASEPPPRAESTHDRAATDSRNPRNSPDGRRVDLAAGIDRVTENVVDAFEGEVVTTAESALGAEL